tara:strand:+ start:691 stop:1020 length:330 start_codon:yes stop_codon:yes gene_type:complete
MSFDFFKKHKKLLFIVILFFLLFHKKRTIVQTYNDGYQAGWNERDVSSFCMSHEAKIGYDQGLSDSCAYDQGYDDAFERKVPEYLDDPDYMDGYNDAKKDKLNKVVTYE